MSRLLIITFLFSCISSIAQDKGNSSFNQPRRNTFHNDDVEVKLTSNETLVTIRGLTNVKADAFLAVFSVMQVGPTASVTDSLMAARITSFDQALMAKRIDSVHLVADMISLVPRFDYNVIHKLFSKTFQEVPDGFELSKNILVSYKNASDLERIVSAATSVEIYDLARVEYFVTNIKQHYEQLRKECIETARRRIDSYSMLGTRLDTLPRTIAEDFKAYGPDQRYNEYLAVSRPSLRAAHRATGGPSKFGSADTPLRSQYYHPLSYTDFDVVINPLITEPVVQITYDLRISIHEKSCAQCSNNVKNESR